MQINSSGFVKATLYDYLEALTIDIQNSGNFGSDFTIKKEGIIDNILTAVSDLGLEIEDTLAFALKQLNPYTAEGVWQDKLYALVGLYRNFETYTKVTRTIAGTPGTTIDVNELVFKTNQDNQYYLNTAVTIGENGTVVGSFTAYESGAIECDTDSDLTIVSAPLGVTGVYYTSGDNTTIIGDDYVDDSEFRLRWIATNSAKVGSNTEGGLKTALLPLVGNDINNIKIRQNRNTVVYEDLDLHTMNIVLKSGESNQTIAETIFNNVVDGNLVGLDGNVSVTVQDDEGEDVVIKFDRASAVTMYFNVEIVLKDGYTLSQVTTNVKNAIVDNFNYSMGERVVANDFYQYINNVDGVDYVTVLAVSKTSSDYKQTETVDYNEYGATAVTNITVSEAE